jgi:tetratricopeptide (TPR) repeat protein
MPTPIDIFIAYAKEDEAIVTELKSHLSPLERNQSAKVWYDGMVVAGEEWQSTTKNALQNAKIILLIISADFIASDECYNDSLKPAIDLHNAGKCRVIPILARPCLWQESPFAKLHPLPQNQNPIMSSSWKNQEEPYSQIADSLRVTIGHLQGNILQPYPHEEGNTNAPSSRLRLPTRTWYFAGGALMALVIAFFMYQYFEGKDKKAAIEKAIETRQKDSTVAYKQYLYCKEIADVELIGQPSLQDYWQAYYHYQKALDAVRDYKINDSEVRAKLEKCQLAIGNTQINTDSTYLKAVQLYQTKVGEGHKLYKDAVILKDEKKNEEAIALFKKAKTSYDEAIILAGNNKIDIRAAKEGSLSCQDQILILQTPVVVANVKTSVEKPATANNRQNQSRVIRKGIPPPPKAKDLSHWLKSLEKHEKMDSISEKYQKW